MDTVFTTHPANGTLNLLEIAGRLAEWNNALRDMGKERQQLLEAQNLFKQQIIPNPDFAKVETIIGNMNSVMDVTALFRVKFLSGPLCDSSASLISVY